MPYGHAALCHPFLKHQKQRNLGCGCECSCKPKGYWSVYKDVESATWVERWIVQSEQQGHQQAGKEGQEKKERDVQLGMQAI